MPPHPAKISTRKSRSEDAVCLTEPLPNPGPSLAAPRGPRAALPRPLICRSPRTRRRMKEADTVKQRPPRGCPTDSHTRDYYKQLLLNDLHLCIPVSSELTACWGRGALQVTCDPHRTNTDIATPTSPAPSGGSREHESGGWVWAALSSNEGVFASRAGERAGDR